MGEHNQRRRISNLGHPGYHDLYSAHLTDSRPTEISGRANTLVLEGCVHTSGVVIAANTLPYASGSCRLRRAANSSFPVSRTMHFDMRSAISVARTCLHWNQPGMIVIKICRGRDTYRQLRLRYQHGVREGWTSAEVWNGAGPMQTRKDCVRICHSEDRKVVSTPWRNVLDH